MKPKEIEFEYITPSYLIPCKICGISAFSHRHYEGKKPKDYERIEEPQSAPFKQTLVSCSCGPLSKEEKERVKAECKTRNTTGYLVGDGGYKSSDEILTNE